MTLKRKGKRVLRARVRKPKPLTFYVTGRFRSTVHAGDYSARKLRMLHNWTGRALAWLSEQEKNK